MPSIYHSMYNTYCVLLLIVNSVCGDYYHTSRSHLNNLLEIQDKLINKITYFIHQEHETLRALENYVKLLKKERTKSLEDVKTYLDNPINVFTLIKRLTYDLDSVESQICNTTALEIDKDKYPDMDDLEGAVAAMERVRLYYLINTTEMANGILKGAKSNPLSVGDCYYLALVLSKHEKHNNSIEWLAQALLKYSLGEPTYPTRLQAILRGLVHSFEALDDHINAELCKKRASQMSYDRVSFRTMAEELISLSSTFYYYNKQQTVQNTLCRGEVNVSRKVQSKLKCYYLTYNNYFLILAPFKLEQLYIDPDVNMVHDVMNDNEIQHFIDEGKRNMTRATDINTNQNMMYRIAKIAWFDPSHSDIMNRVSKRMAHFSGCDMTRAEALQICNYGIGGHYVAHYDLAFPEDLKSKLNANGNGNRYATVLVYLSDVASGGATVFIKLGITVPVKKGAAIFWRNLLPTGEGDLKTLHAACPVILGNKWDDNINAELWKKRASQMSYNRESFRKMAEELISWSSTFYYFDKEQTVENALCRGEVNISRKVQSKLKCYYLTYNISYLILAPFKLKQLYIDPDVNMVHDVMTDNEIQHFIDEGQRNMTRATDLKTRQNMMYRISKIAWYNPSHSAIMNRVSKRMAHFSGCAMTRAETLQICNYGIGGHYLAHYDHAYSEDLKSKLNVNRYGNRYATILVYLSDVASGGATVFVKLGMTVPVKKGAAIFWRNLLPTGEGDPKTLHAACPVILGNKWVVNKWVREAGQEFTSLCTDDQKKSKA